MHEYSIVQALYDSVVAQAAAHGAVSVQAVHVRIGELSGVDPGLLDTAWRTFRVRTICEHAPMDVEIVAARWACPVCATGVPRGRVLRCPDCGAAVRLAQGDEIILNRIVMEVP
jgi:hydrogenase nickel incorporation protein HypA/HybF